MFHVNVYKTNSVKAKKGTCDCWWHTSYASISSSWRKYCQFWQQTSKYSSL